MGAIKNFYIRKTVWKGARRAGQVLAAYGSTLLAKKAGIELTPEQQAALTAAITGALESAINVAKQKYQINWL